MSWLHRFHLGERPVVGVGQLDVVRGSSLISRCLGLLRVPRQGPNQPLRVWIEEKDGIEIWSRLIGGRRLDSRLRRDGNLLVESAGPAELRMRQHVTDEDIAITPITCALRVGRLRSAVPDALAPHCRPWISWRGGWALVFAVLLLAEICITIADFIVEDQVRKPLGGLRPGERTTHTIMAIVYGAILANLIPVLVGWWRLPSGLVGDPPPVPLWLRLALSALALGILVSAIRDAYAVAGFPSPLARWPWRPRHAATRAE